MNKIILLSVVLIFGIFKTNEKDIPVLAIDPAKDKESTFYLSEYASDVQYIKLETNDICLISEITKVLVVGEDVFLTSHQNGYTKLLRFSLEGKFINEIGKWGRGPGEYSTVLDFTVDRFGKSVYLLDTSGKILHFTYEGKMLDTYRLDAKPSSLIYFNSSLAFFSAWPDYYLNKGCGIQIIKVPGYTTDTLILNRKWIKGTRVPGVMIYPNYFYGLNNDGSLSFIEAKFDTLYNIDARYNVKPKLVISLIDDIPRDLLTTDDYRKANKKYNSMSAIIETRRFLFFKVITANPVNMLFYIFDKTTNQLIKHNVTKDNQYFVNDWDGGVTFRPQGIACEQVLFASIDCYKIKDFLCNQSSNKTLCKYPESRDNLKNLVQESGMDDNPVIMLITLKK